MRPIDCAFYKAMLHWIDIDVVYMVGIVSITADQVFPKTPLPNTALPFVAP